MMTRRELNLAAMAAAGVSNDSVDQVDVDESAGAVVEDSAGTEPDPLELAKAAMRSPNSSRIYGF